MAEVAAARQWASVTARQPFDLEQGPLIRVRVLRLAPTTHVLVATLHHAVSDGWSLEILAREFTALYAAFTAGQPSPLAPLPLQYADFAVWQRTWLQGPVLDAQLAYWRTQLAGVAPLPLPTDAERPAVPTHAAAAVPWALDPALTTAVRALSRAAGVTVFMTVLAALQVVLGRLAGQDDVVVGTDVANRTHEETEGLIGFFVNQLVLRTSLAGDPSVTALLGQVRETCLAAYAHQDLPFERLVEALAPARSLTRAPLFQVKLLLDRAPRGADAVGGLTLAPFASGAPLIKLDLRIALVDTPSALVGTLQYATALWARETVARLGVRLQQVLAAMVADPTQRVRALPLVTADEQAQWDAAPRDAPAPCVAVPAQIAAQAAATPDAVALVGEAPDVEAATAIRAAGASLPLGAVPQVTYGTLWARASALAAALRAWGVGPEVRVAVCLDRGVDPIVALLGVLEAGGA